MAYNQPIKVPPGVIRRQALEDVLKYPSDVQLVQKATEEYIDMLAIEKYFSEIDSNTHKSLCKKYERISVSGYSVFGEELIAEHKNSKLIKHIMGVYKSKRLALCQKAMLEFSLLKEICTAYEKHTTQNKRENLSSTYSGTGNSRVNPQELQTSTFYQTAHPSQNQRTTRVADNAPVEIHGQMFYPETMYKQLEHRASEQFKDIDTLQKDLKDANLQINELRNRLSGFASKQLTEGNPDFTDLSDKNRPTKIAEMFHNIYDEEWTSALEALTHVKKGSEPRTEEQAIKLLMEVIKRGYAFCDNYARRQEENFITLWNQCIEKPFSSAISLESAPGQNNKKVPKIVLSEFRNSRKVECNETIKNAIKEFNTEVLSKLNHKDKDNPAVIAYASRCIEALWLMAIQDPPMTIDWPKENSKFDSGVYKEYCRKGQYVKLPVWPAVYLHKNGPLVNKGYAMPE